MATDGRHQKYDKATYRRREIRSWIICLATAVAIALFLRFFVLEMVLVDGQSMEPTLHSHQTLFIEKVTKLFSTLDRGQIVVVKYPDMDGVYVKRIVGIPGDTIEVKDGALYLNGNRKEEPYINTDYINYDMEEITVPEDCYFVMGDNRNNSMDSHDDYIGPIPKENVVGRAIMVIWPLDEIEIVTNVKII